ncbi:hypothetical protein DICPUDRAFT_152847 [Dictyostelium purpureum]|uniref:Uncharacterized protein n=1 Tax=Dictyostelium purpureum TaxID=5786 RepID=F0ZMF3_DICPU|nr:uncharacterized protein DICPUDRAFT_152847 [Dictyostelium purpureum]EGC34890.1 hypothetical protein DICPUDRAFT_152847 [Dictyostelium purpureum]|eukprot:XP_003288582.1 hypothetical protein DICPUDRAFT_152847 [Dictyostelium purpureum]
MKDRFYLVQSTTKFTDDQIKRIAGERSDINLRCRLKEKYIHNNNKSPVMYLTRKPHTNGLLNYMVGTFLECIHHLSSPKKSTVSQSKRGSVKEFKYPYIIEFLNKLDNEIHPSIGDSAFFSKDNLNHIVNKAWLATISDFSSSKLKTLLKDTLKYDKSWIEIELDGYYKVCKIDKRESSYI